VNKTLAELAEHVGGKVVGDSQVIIEKVASIDEAGLGAITFLANPRYRRYLSVCRASAVIVGTDVVRGLPLRDGRGYLAASDPYWAFAKILQLFQVLPQFSRTVSDLAYVAQTAVLGEAATIFPHAYVSGGVKIGRRTVVYPGVFLGEGSAVGEDCVLHPTSWSVRLLD
jgi:UDP-3-O-[3-hydroxymyristoyl] glucosamine N-acyltransferase